MTFWRQFYVTERNDACTAPQKDESTLLYTYVLNDFFTADRSCITKYFEKNHIEVGSSHLYASFGTFCVQIGQLF